MTRKRPLTSHGVRKLSERERAAGVDPADDASKWLQEHDPPPPPPPAAPRTESGQKVKGAASLAPGAAEEKTLGGDACELFEARQARRDSASVAAAGWYEAATPT